MLLVLLAGRILGTVAIFNASTLSIVYDGKGVVKGVCRAKMGNKPDEGSLENFAA